MKVFNAAIVLLSGIIITTTAMAQSAPQTNQNLQMQIEALQAQIKAMEEKHDKEIQRFETQLGTIKEQLAGYQVGVAEKLQQQLAPADMAKSWFHKATQSGGFKLRDAVGLEDDSKLNIAGELNVRYRQDTNEKVTIDQGFQFYEIELFLDAAVNKYTSIFIEYPIHHKNYLNPGNTWIDFHMPGELAATEYTGLMIGNFSPRFGYLNYDDNQSWIYGGRTTVNTSLVRGRSIDDQTIRNRQMGVSMPIRLPLANYDWGWLLVEPGLNNGDGPIEFYGGSDNDKRIDTSGRIQYTFPNDLGLVGTGFWHSPKTAGATSNTAGTRWGGSGAKHVREIDRYSVYAKFPNVQQATLPDLSLGGKPFMVYGEYIWGTFRRNSGISAFNFTQDFAGWYVETNVNIIRDKVVGILRFDYFDPNTSVINDTQYAITPAIKVNLMSNVWLTGEYEGYWGGANATNKDEDRFAFELNVWF